MRKKFKKRLLGIILTILMVVSVIPVQQVQPVQAAMTLKVGDKIYFKVISRNNGTFGEANAVPAVYLKTSATDGSGTWQTMTEVPGESNIYQYKVDKDNVTYVAFRRMSEDGITYWHSMTSPLEINGNMYTSEGWNNSSETNYNPKNWCTYSEGSDTQKTTSTFYVKASLVDYFNNGRVKKPEDKFYNEGNLTGSNNAPYSQLNQWLSGLKGYASNGIDDKNNDNAPVPLYFGDLLHAKQAGGNLTWYWKGANVAFGSNDNETNKYVAQGIVGDHLDKNGNLITSYTNNGEPVKVPFFNEKAYDDQSNYMRFYNNLQFPFTKTTNDKGVSTYSFNSEQNTVYYDYDNNKIVRKDTLVIHDASEQKNRGYFPFNSTDPSDSNKDNLNYGFGTQFTIPFTVTGDGKNVDDTPMTFKFTGDDDVWVYIDGALVLDMGGAHEKAEGEINFETQTATIKTGTSNAKLGNQPTAGGRVASEDNEKSTVNFSDIKVKKSDNTTVTLADHMKTSGTVHELKMYYMERGMWNSNMSISYSFVPLPSGLTLSKTLDTTNVNAGLKNEVQGLDKFDFKIQTKNLKAGEKNYSDVANLGYTLYDYNDNTYPGKVAENSTATFSSSYFASEFIKTTDEDNSSAFYAGTGFKITESIPKGTKLQYDTSKTRWGVYDSVTSRAAIQGETGAIATFDMGSANSSDMDVVNRYVNFVNTPKVGNLSVKKIYEGNAPEDKNFGFTVKVDLTGGKTYIPYELEYTIGSKTEKTDEKGHFTLKADDTITFKGIPAGASYEVVEDKPEAGDTWEQDTAKCTKLTGTIVAGETSAASVTNKTHSETVDKVIYVEAGDGKKTEYQPKEVTSDYVVKDLSDGLNYDSTTKEFNVKTPNEKYTASYTGKNAKGDVSGTITVYSYAVSNDVYVFDYGLKSDLADITHGAGMFQNDNLFNQNVEGGTAKFTALNTEKLTQSTITGTTGTELTQLTDDEGNKLPGAKLSEQEKVEFNPTAFMDKQETASYETTVLGKDKTKVETAEDGVVMSADVTVMPANVVYYEDNFNAGSTNTDGTAKIVYSGTTSTEGTSVELTQSNGQTEQYGHDDAYAKGNGDSNGSSTKMTADGYNTTASFTFKGTGFDIVARTTTDTAGIVCIIEKKNGEKFELVKTVSVDTYYANGALYQIPVIHEEGLDYGTYQITLGAKATTKSCVVYLDGVRIYNPMGTESNNNYIANENDVTITKISDLVIGANADITESGIKDKETGDTITSQTIEGANAALLTYGESKDFAAMGATRIENDETAGAGTTKSLLTYLHAGPNNEMYLDDNAMIAFVANGTPGNNSTIQIEAKLSNTDSTGAVAKEASLPLKIWNGIDDEESEIATVSSSTAMYYKIPVENCIKLADNKYLVVILGAIEPVKDKVCLSFTNLKYKGYTITNPLAYNEIVNEYIETESATQEKVFVSVDKLNLNRRQWYTANHAVVLSKDVFGTEEPKFTMYYVNAKGKETAISVTATKDKSVENKYWLTFKAPNAIGNFPVQIRYVVNGVESEEYISTTMNVKR